MTSCTECECVVITVDLIQMAVVYSVECSIAERNVMIIRTSNYRYLTTRYSYSPKIAMILLLLNLLLFLIV